MDATLPSKPVHEMTESPTDERARDGAHRASRWAGPGAWVTTTYFAEGYPYAIVNNLAEVLFKEMGASLQTIGLTSLFHLPWNLKLLWAPFVDQVETKRRWIVSVEVALTLGLVALALGVSSPRMIWATAAVFVAIAVLAATQDIAIDGFYLEALDAQGQSRLVGMRAMAYKVASLVVRGPLVILIGWVGWRMGLAAAAVIMGLLTTVHARLLPNLESRRQPWSVLLRAALRPRIVTVGAIIALVIVLHRRFGTGSAWMHRIGDTLRAVPWIGELSASGWIAFGLLAALVAGLVLRKRIVGRFTRGPGSYSTAFVDFMARPMVGRVLAFVVLFRAGESFLQKMKWPFLRDVLGMSLDQYGFANGTLGVIASFAGTFVGGWLISRHGLARWIWPFAALQNVLNLLYMGLAIAGAQTVLGIAPIAGVIMTEHFGEGLGTAAFMVYLMRSCDPAHKASHMAILTALMSVSFTLAGVASGFLARSMGFTWYFAFTFLASLPGMALIAFLPNLRDTKGSPDQPASSA